MNLSVPSSTLNTLHDNLIQEDEKERFAYLYCGVTGNNKLLAGDYKLIPDNQLRQQSGTAVRPELDIEREHLQHCIESGLAPVIIHSHPFAERAGFSSIDVGTMDSYKDWLTGLNPGEPFGFAVISKKDLEATVFDPVQEKFTDLSIEVLGDWRLTDELSTTSRSNDASNDELDENLYDRNIRAITQEGQKQICSTHAAIVGCGGLGSVIVEELARLGVNQFTLIDPDHVEKSNLSRLVGAFPEHTGKPKVEALKQHIWHLAPDSSVNTFQKPVEEVTGELAEADVLFTGLDTVAARSVVNEHAVRHLQPWIDTGVIIETGEENVDAMRGTVQTVIPGVTGCYHCVGRHDPEQARIDRLDEEELQHEINEGYVDADIATPEPAIIHLNSTVASIAVQEFNKLVTGFNSPTGLIQFNALSHELKPMKTERGTNCPICGENSVIGRADADRNTVEDNPADQEELPATALH